MPTLFLKTCRVLKSLATRGTSVLCTIHQPSSEIFDEFDSLYLLSNGSCVFGGSKNEAASFFSSVGLPCKINFNPADHYIYQTSLLESSRTDFIEKIERLTNCYGKSKEFENMRKSRFEPVEFDQELTKIMKIKDDNVANPVISFMCLLWRSTKASVRS